MRRSIPVVVDQVARRRQKDAEGAIARIETTLGEQYRPLVGGAKVKQGARQLEEMRNKLIRQKAAAFRRKNHEEMPPVTLALC